MIDYSKYTQPTNQHMFNQYIYGQLYHSKKWYVRPLDWAGIWQRKDDKVYLVSGNIEKQFDTEQECIDYIKIWVLKMKKNTNDLERKIGQALDIAFKYSQIDGSHHKAWVIDQMVRVLLGDGYKKWIERYMFNGEDPIDTLQTDNYYEWDTGIAP